ncbi:MAG: hypothetical protein ACJASJ_000887 [Candidatus Azotimanducaceae bacterium]|jgi:hypothetical protein
MKLKSTLIDAQGAIALAVFIVYLGVGIQALIT